MNLTSIIDDSSWIQITEELNVEGYALLHNIFSSEELAQIRQWGFQGSGSNLLPDSILTLREALYPRLAIIANDWNYMLGVDMVYPLVYSEFKQLNTERQQEKPYFVLSMLNKDGYEPLHQNNDGLVTFPMQIVILLSSTQIEFTGGEIVMTEQRPRMQSRPIALNMGAGDVAIMTVSHKPSRGSKGNYRVNIKHAVSTVFQGTRYGIEVMFHNRS